MFKWGGKYKTLRNFHGLRVSCYTIQNEGRSPSYSNHLGYRSDKDGCHKSVESREESEEVDVEGSGNPKTGVLLREGRNTRTNPQKCKDTKVVSGHN